VVGSANIDLTTFTSEFPRPGETIFGRAFKLGFGGKGANQAVAAALCGADVSIVARVGDDLFGPATIDNFRSQGIDASHVWITAGQSSGVAPIFVDNAGQNRIIVVKGANDALSPADIDNASDVLIDADCVVLQLEVPVETVYYALRFARESGVRTILNPAPGQKLDAPQAALADYLIPNETEAEAIAGIEASNLEEARACARRLIDQGYRKVVITLGANGALAADAEGEEHLPPYKVEPVDTTGAGDAFIGCFAYFLAAGCAEREAIERANVYAALSTLKIGAQMSFPSRKQLESAWAGRARRSLGA
jgi:ribokinase